MPENLRQFALEIYGADDVFQPGNPHVPRITAWHQHRAIIKDSMGVCDWIYPVLRPTLDSRQEWAARLESGEGSLLGDPGAEARLFRAATGIELTIDEMERPIAERIVTLERCLDVRNTGRTRADDEAVIPHFQWAGKVDGTQLSASGDEFREMLEAYYRLRGWDVETGHPTRETVERLGLAATTDDGRRTTG
jgi:aldehyde:ferredoxin oxidoreductase